MITSCQCYFRIITQMPYTSPVSTLIRSDSKFFEVDGNSTIDLKEQSLNPTVRKQLPFNSRCSRCVFNVHSAFAALISLALKVKCYNWQYYQAIHSHIKWQRCYHFTFPINRNFLKLWTLAQQIKNVSFIEPGVYLKYTPEVSRSHFFCKFVCMLPQPYLRNSLSCITRTLDSSFKVWRTAKEAKDTF